MQEIDVGSGVIENFRGQSYFDIKQCLQRSKNIFTDPEFPPNLNSIFFSPSQKKSRGIEWKRPHVIPCLMEQEIDPNHPEKYCGIFHFRFWRFGKWMDVVVDDLLPTKNGKLIFAHSKTNNEFWSALLEKASAKLNGCYEALISGSLAEAFVELSGGVPETIKIANSGNDNLRRDSPDKFSCLFIDVKDAFDKKSLIAAAINDSTQVEKQLNCGLVTGHSYAVTAVREIELDSMSPTQPLCLLMIRLHNPWGEKEWNGPWSDGSPEWNLLVSDEQKQNIGLIFEEDGEFWMEWKDFCQYFTEITICHTNSHMQEKRFYGRWIQDHSKGHLTNRAGGCLNFKHTCLQNPQYRVDVCEEDCKNQHEAILCLTQDDARYQRKFGFCHSFIGLHVLQVENNRKHRVHRITTCVATSEFVNSRSVFLRMKNLMNGRYVIVPSTFNPGVEKNFLLRIFTPLPSQTKSVVAEAGFVMQFTLNDYNLGSDVCSASRMCLSGLAVFVLCCLLKKLCIELRKDLCLEGKSSYQKQSPETPSFTFTKVIVENAAYLPASDTYCVVKFGKKECRSPPVFNSRNPQYNFACLFCEKAEIVSVQLYQSGSRDSEAKFIGEVSIATEVGDRMQSRAMPLVDMDQISQENTLLTVQFGTFTNPLLL